MMSTMVIILTNTGNSKPINNFLIFFLNSVDRHHHCRLVPLIVDRALPEPQQGSTVRNPYI